MSRIWKILLILIIGVQTSFSAQLTITLKAKADIEPGVVYLGQIANIKGEPELVKRIAAVEVGKVMEPGRKTRVTERAVRDFFIKSVAGSQNAVFNGAKFCDVVARSELVSADSLRTLLLREVRSRMPANLEEGKDWIFETSKVPNSLDVPKHNSKVLLTLSPNFTGIGQEIATVQVFNGKKIISKHSISFTIRRFDHVAELKNGIRKGEMIAENDFKMVWQETTFQKRKVIKKAEEAIGRTAIRQLRAGDILVDNALTAPYAVKEGESVRVFVRIGGAVVQTNAVAQRNAFKGQTISLRNLDTGRDILATVSEKGEAWVN
ncbi:MAG: flagellar basal body P-ring formation chaperone FlgA [Fibromonadaceae bacterium]|jgi:flagella basal body P-ring formation protein FlgA|nr:flagellar basal body P-ring formation chaperone FlgA [Fibromonadaceae bacterium]